jgi:hypothetical protein
MISTARIDAGLLGKAAYFVAPGVVLAAAGFGLLFRDSARLITAALETAVPLVVGIFAASVLASEPALELQLSTPYGFRPAALRRLSILFGWSAAVCLAGWWIADATGALAGWRPPADAVESQLLWLPSLAAYAVGGCLLAVVLRSRSAAVSAVALFWVGGHAFHDVFTTTPWLRFWYPFMTTYEATASDWATVRILLLAAAAVAIVPLAAMLGVGEWLIGGEDR